MQHIDNGCVCWERECDESGVKKWTKTKAVKSKCKVYCSKFGIKFRKFKVDGVYEIGWVEYKGSRSVPNEASLIPLMKKLVWNDTICNLF